jgi:hypothetical protein
MTTLCYLTVCMLCRSHILYIIHVIHTYTIVKKFKNSNIRSEVLTAMTMKSAVFLDMTSSNQVEVHRRFGGTYRLHLQSRRVIHESNQQETNSKRCWLAYCLALKMETARSFEMSEFYWTTRHHIAEWGSLKNKFLYRSLHEKFFWIVCDVLYDLSEPEVQCWCDICSWGNIQSSTHF